MITDSQLEDRSKGIGSSDVPTILGLNPWGTAHDLWLSKTGQLPPCEENEAMHMGNMLEEVVLKLAAERLEQRVVRPSSTFVGCHPFMRANIDGMVGKAKRGAPIVEAKTTSGYGDEWGSDGTDQVPERVRAQVMFQMMCSSSDVAYVACLRGDFGLKFALHRVEWDRHYAEHIMERVVDFWTFVERRVAPPVAPSMDAMKRLTRIADAPVVPIPPELFEAEARAKAALEAAEAAHDAAKATLVAALGQGTKGEGGGWKVTVSTVDTDRFNAKAFLADHPDYAEQYRLRGSHSRITIKAPKAKENK